MKKILALILSLTLSFTCVFALVGCGECERSCPVHTIEMIRDKHGKKKAMIHADKCIRCFCCQELCPIHSVDIRKNAVLNLLAQLRR